MNDSLFSREKDFLLLDRIQFLKLNSLMAEIIKKCFKPERIPHKKNSYN